MMLMNLQCQETENLRGSHYECRQWPGALTPGGGTAAHSLRPIPTTRTMSAACGQKAFSEALHQ